MESEHPTLPPSIMEPLRAVFGHCGKYWNQAVDKDPVRCLELLLDDLRMYVEADSEVRIADRVL